MAREAVDRALALDPDLATAHASDATVLSWYEWDFEAAERAFLRAIELDPDDAFAHYWYSSQLDFLGRREQARNQLDRALALDPLALQIRNGLANHYQWAGQLDSAIAMYRTILRIDPAFHNARRWLGIALLEARRPAEGLAAFDSLPAGFARNAGLRAWGLAQLGRTAEAAADLQNGVSLGEADLQYAIQGHASLGRFDEAFELISNAIDGRYYNVLRIGLLPATDPLRADPRFELPLARIGLPRQAR